MKKTESAKTKESTRLDGTSDHHDFLREKDNSFLEQIEKANAACGKLFQAICEGDLSHPAVRFCCDVAVSEEGVELPEHEKDMAIAAVALTNNIALLENLGEPETVAFYDQMLKKSRITSATSRRDMFDDMAKNRRLLLFRTRRAAAALYSRLGWGELPPEGWAGELVQVLKYGR